MNKGQKVWAKLKYSPYWPAEVRIKFYFLSNILPFNNDKIISYLRLLRFHQKSQKHHEIEFASGFSELKTSKALKRFFLFLYATKHSILCISAGLLKLRT